MGDVKNSLSTKIKSVKRRKSSSAQATCGKLEDISAALNEKSEFLKKIQDGKTEGLYADVNAFGSEVKISPHIWKKIIKGIAHEDRGVSISVHSQSVFFLKFGCFQSNDYLSSLQIVPHDSHDRLD